VANLTVQDPKTKLRVALAIGTRPEAGRGHVPVLRVPFSVAVDTPAIVSFDGANVLSIPKREDVLLVRSSRVVD
jgi:hypothetical protein